MKQYVVYRILNIRNKRVYIGSTSQFEIRKAEHLGQLRTKKHCNKLLQTDFNDFKEEGFIFEIIADGFKTREAMLLREYELILKTQGKNYNIHTDCPVIGHSKKSKSLRGKRLLIGKFIDSKKRTKVKSHTAKMQHPKLDAIIEKKKEREQRQAKYRDE
jgi:predicted GIY-YIG superfamily endonuclease